MWKQKIDCEPQIFTIQAPEKINSIVEANKDINPLHIDDPIALHRDQDDNFSHVILKCVTSSPVIPVTAVCLVSIISLTALLYAIKNWSRPCRQKKMIMTAKNNARNRKEQTVSLKKLNSRKNTVIKILPTICEEEAKIITTKPKLYPAKIHQL